MNFEPSEDQQALRESFARFLSKESSMQRVRAAMPLGFDPALWSGLAEFGIFAVRVPDEDGGLGLGTLDAVLLMEEVGRTLASGPVAEAIVAARLLALTGSDAGRAQLERLVAGTSVVSIASRDLAHEKVQWVAGGAVADAVVARNGNEILLISVPEAGRKSEPNLASTPIAELDLAAAARVVLASGAEAVSLFNQAIEEWKLLMAAAANGLAREAIRLASIYATERVAFGQPIGTYQAISHPLADLITAVEGGRYFIWSTINDIAQRNPNAAANVSLAAWWNFDTASHAAMQGLHTFGGYGLTTEYDIHLYNLRAKAWPLVFGDPTQLLGEAGRRQYAGETASLPDVGDVTIDFDFGDEARALAAETDAFFTETLTPALKAKAHYSFDGHDAGFHRQLGDAGLLFPNWPRALGGREAHPYAVHASRQVWGKHDWTTHSLGTTAMVGSIVQAFGTDELKQEALTRIASGEAVCSLGFSEPGSGSDVFAAATRATPVGNGWRIDGQKMFTSGANISDYVLLLTRTDPDVPKHKGLTMFLVPLKAPGVSIQPVHTFQDERTNITFYDDVRIPDSYRLGPVNGGVKVMAASLEMEHGGGFSDHQKEMLHAAEALCREIPYRGGKLIEDGIAQTRLARTAAHVQIAELLGFRSLWGSVEKKPGPAVGPMSKMFSSEKFLSDAADLLNLTAPYSLSKRPGPAEALNRFYRHAHGTTIYGGTSEVHRSMIAERALGLPRTRA